MEKLSRSLSCSLPVSSHSLGPYTELVPCGVYSVHQLGDARPTQGLSVTCSGSISGDSALGTNETASLINQATLEQHASSKVPAESTRQESSCKATSHVSETPFAGSHVGIQTVIPPVLTPEELARAAGTLKPGFKVLLISEANNCMTQRTWLELTEMGLDVCTHFYTDEAAMICAVSALAPDLIICPFLTKRIPAEIYENKSVPCLIIHPGPEGDRGMSSLDWALLENEEEWGVTLLQAEEEMDAGPIWSTHKFLIDKLHPPTKSSLYRTECINAAMKGVHDVLEMIARGSPQPRVLDYSNPNVTGRLRERMIQADRRIDWALPAADIARIIRAGDSQPGVLDTIAGEKYFLFGVHVEANPPVECCTLPTKSILGKRHGAILVTCGSKGEALWISHLRRPNLGNKRNIKLPATVVLPPDVVDGIHELSVPSLVVPFGKWPDTFQEIFTWERNDVCYLWFDFYNGAMNTGQCSRLAVTLEEMKRTSSARVVVLMGGQNFFSNGINLNTIEAAGSDSFEESWENINAIDDFVQQVLTAKDILTVSVIGGNAGAGGVMAAISADEVWTHENIVLNPHYKAMALYGSEYWTYSLSKRVGHKKAAEIVDSTLPMSASTALQSGLVDHVMEGCGSRHEFLQRVIERAEMLASDPNFQRKIIAKKAMINNEAFQQKIQECRESELQQMHHSLASSEFHAKRHAFVFKIRSGTACLPSQQVANLKALNS